MLGVQKFLLRAKQALYMQSYEENAARFYVRIYKLRIHVNIQKIAKSLV